MVIVGALCEENASQILQEVTDLSCPCDEVKNMCREYLESKNLESQRKRNIESKKRKLERIEDLESSRRNPQKLKRTAARKIAH